MRSCKMSFEVESCYTGLILHHSLVSMPSVKLKCHYPIPFAKYSLPWQMLEAIEIVLAKTLDLLIAIEDAKHNCSCWLWRSEFFCRALAKENSPSHLLEGGCTGPSLLSAIRSHRIWNFSFQSYVIMMPVPLTEKLRDMGEKDNKLCVTCHGN